MFTYKVYIWYMRSQQNDLKNCFYLKILQKLLKYDFFERIFSHFANFPERNGVRIPLGTKIFKLLFYAKNISICTFLTILKVKNDSFGYRMTFCMIISIQHTYEYLFNFPCFYVN